MSDEQYKKIFSENLRYFLDKKGKTQSDLVNDLKLSQSTASNWCTGLKLPRINKIQMLADYLGIEKSDLLEKRKPDNEEDLDIRRIQRARRDMPEQDRKRMMEILRLSFVDYFDDDGSDDLDE